MMRRKKYTAIILIILIFIVFISSRIYKPVKPIKGSNLVKVDVRKINNADNNNELINRRNLSGIKDPISIIFEGQQLVFKHHIYNQANRLYIPLSELLINIKGKITFTDKLINISLNNKNFTINNMDKKYWVDGNSSKTLNLKENIIVNNTGTYISLIDLTSILDLKVRWDIDKKEIHLFWNKEKIVPIIKNQTSTKYGLIRLEDITAEQRYRTAEELDKLRAVGDYLYVSGVPFSIAWVPRYIDKAKGIDNDPSKTCNMYNADFVFTMDYLMNRNGLIGIHGYTHQFKDSVSIDGIEFSKEYNNDEVSIRKRLELAIKCATDLDFKYAFFETPHYAATDFQHKIMEQYFKYIYDPNTGSKGRHNNVYVPTPLNYVDGKGDLNNMLRKIGDLKTNQLGSFFYHPSIEFESIKLEGNSEDYPSYKYDEKSVLHQIIDSFDKKGYKFISIMDLK